jgi:murein DD-endopeptidase MepM/ murein hydrolase activator NlpD
MRRHSSVAVWLVVAAVLVPVAVAADARPGAQARGGGYAWPVKPFAAAHPIRSTFGDPRTWFDGPPTPATLALGAGSFAFHQGVDIVAPDGTAVYPVRSGTARLGSSRTVIVDIGGGNVDQYWHIVPSVRKGQHVVAYETILGRIRPSYGHVHFTELHHGVAVNPLAPGHLELYRDTTPPTIKDIKFRKPGTSQELLPELVRGKVEIVVQASDLPDHGAPGIWAGMPTVPARVTWRVERARDEAPVTPEKTSFDVRQRVPRDRDFWSVYARGTRQNMATFKGHRYWRMEGVFIFRLGVLDTRTLPNGIYTLVTTASDIGGNRATAHQTFLIYNRRGWPPVTPQA